MTTFQSDAAKLHICCSYILQFKKSDGQPVRFDFNDIIRIDQLSRRQTPNNR